MKKSEYLKILKENLSGLEKNSIKDIIEDIEEHFLAGIEEGKSEEEICSDLGDPISIANTYKQEEEISPNKKVGFNSILRMFLLGSSLMFVNIVFVLGIYIGILGAYIAILLSSISISIVGFISILVAIIPSLGFYLNIYGIKLYTAMDRLFLFFSGLGSLSAGIFLTIILVILGRYIIKWTNSYIKVNINLVKKAGK